MPPSVTAPDLIRAVGLLPDGPAPWGRPVRASGPGILVVELAAPLPAAPLDLARVGSWLERVPALRLDGVRPTSRDLVARLAAFWIPSSPILLVGSARTSVAGRLAALARTVPGDARPAWSALWLHLLRDGTPLRAWWASTDAPEEYEDALLDAFAAAVPAAERGALRASDPLLPWAVLRGADGRRKATGIANPTLPEPVAPAPVPISRIVELPPDEADGARDEAARGRRPAKGRGAGRLASAAAFAAQGSPRRAPEQVVLSPEGRRRLEEELAGLVAERPAVVARIATAREHGDLKENAEYHAAREEQGFLEGRIRALEARLRTATVVAPAERGGAIEVGSRVRVEIDGELRDLVVVGPAEADAGAGRISTRSPVGAALLGRRVGDVVTILAPIGELRYRIVEVD